ncbi:MAG: hypothetical protein JWQ73_3569 [Variovorax sp.]|nr:hypothetical protein [Variovorax sp.]
MRSVSRALAAIASLFVLGALTGCATGWVVDSDVRSFSRLAAAPAPAEATYRFERLPSQQSNEAAQQSLEAMAAAALGKVGLRRDDAQPRYSAQIDARVNEALSPLADPLLYGAGPWAPWGPGFRYGVYGRHGFSAGLGYGYGGFYGPAFPDMSNPWYVREVSVVLRELASGQVVYETHASNDGPYNRSADILPVMFEAALQGFPNPPAGERRVDIALPGANMPTPPAAPSAPARP